MGVLSEALPYIAMAGTHVVPQTASIIAYRTLPRLAHVWM